MLQVRQRESLNIHCSYTSRKTGATMIIKQSDAFVPDMERTSFHEKKTIRDRAVAPTKGWRMANGEWIGKAIRDREVAPTK